MQNYRLIDDRYLENEQAIALVYEHEKTLAKVFVMTNDDDNKVFGIGFRTPPKNSNGVCHIIEHSVLNGSKKYRTKEPFMDMIKGSLNTFLNAMTYPDKTIYPVASRNDKDFKNLTDVYLDAVFNPRVKEEEKIFRQEGWRYNLEDDKLTYKGVVYNEMRGAMSSLESQVFQNIYKELQPDTIYAHNSGGDPYEIPSLSYDEFLEYYDEFYHPSNSYIFLYGDMDHEAYLEYIDAEYLSNYDFRQVDSTLQKQERFEDSKYSVNYLNTSIEPKDNDSFISYSCLVGDGRDSKVRILAELVSSLLIDNDSSPLRQKLLSSGLLEVVFSASQTTLEASFSIVAKNIDADDRDAFVEIIETELNKIVEKGIDKEVVMTEINDFKYDLREKGGYSTKGIAYFTKAFDSWLYDESPIDGIDIEKDVKYIEDNLDNGVIEDFIKNNILNSNHKSIVTHIPRLGINKQRDLEVEKLLEAKKDYLSAADKQRLENERLEMADFQNRENTEEEKATIPSLAKSDVNTNLPRIDRQVVEKDDFVILKHNLATSGVDYLDLAFSFDHITNPEDIMYASLLTVVLANIDTKKYDYSDLNKKIYLATGGLNFSINQFRNIESNKLERKLVVNTKLFTENISDARKVIAEILNNTRFKNHSRLKEIILELKASQEIGLLQRAHVMMMNRASSNHVEFYKFSQYVNGIDFMLFIKEIVEKDMAEVAERLQEVYGKIFSRKDLIVNIGSTFENEKLEKELVKLAKSFDSISYDKKPFEFVERRKNEGFATSADVNYLSFANKLNMDYNSKFTVLNNIVSNEFLYSEIRAKGGAYGAGMTTSKIGNFATYSYRDPNLDKTIDAYKNIPNFLESTNLSESDLLSYIIGAVGKIDPPMTERMKSSMDLSMYITKNSFEKLEEDIQNALEVNMEELKSYSTKLKEMLEGASLAVLGNKSTIEENKEMFDEIIEL